MVPLVRGVRSGGGAGWSRALGSAPVAARDPLASRSQALTAVRDDRLPDSVLGRALRLSLVEHDWDRPLLGLNDLLRGSRLDRLVELASMHGVTNSLFLSLRGCPDVDPEAVDLLRARYQKGLARLLRTGAEIESLAGAMADAEIPWLLFKGPVLAGSVYARPDLRSWGDLDLLVAPQRFRQALEVLAAHGSAVLDTDWSMITRERRSQLHLRLPLGSVADLHWHLFNRRFVRDSFAVDTDAILDRAVSTSVEGVAVPTLDPADALVHLCLHAAMSGGNRLRWIKDIERSAAAQPDWGQVVVRAREWRAGRPVGLMLRRARDVLGAAVPDELVSTLVGGVVARIDDQVLRRWPLEEEPRGHEHVSSLWPRSLRDGPAGSGAALWARGREALERRSPHRRGAGSLTSYLEASGLAD